MLKLLRMNHLIDIKNIVFSGSSCPQPRFAVRLNRDDQLQHVAQTRQATIFENNAFH